MFGIFKGSNSKYLSEKYVSNIESNIVIIAICITLLLTSNGNII